MSLSERVLALPALLTEREAYSRFASVLEDKELRRAREKGRIGYYRFKNTIHYREDELLGYLTARLEGNYTRCQAEMDGSKSDDTGSAKLAEPTTASGMTPELEKSAADLLRRGLKTTQRSKSLGSTSSKDQAHRKSRRTY